jgi:hypothetical protein
LALLLAGTLEELAKLVAVGILGVDLAILRALKRVVDDGDHVIGLVPGSGGVFRLPLLHAALLR